MAIQMPMVDDWRTQVNNVNTQKTQNQSRRGTDLQHIMAMMSMSQKMSPDTMLGFGLGKLIHDWWMSQKANKGPNKKEGNNGAVTVGQATGSPSANLAAMANEKYGLDGNGTGPSLQQGLLRGDSIRGNNLANYANNKFGLEQEAPYYDTTFGIKPLYYPYGNLGYRR